MSAYEGLQLATYKSEATDLSGRIASEAVGARVTRQLQPCLFSLAKVR
jgi:hypothetical protein